MLNTPLSVNDESHAESPLAPHRLLQKYKDMCFSLRTRLFHFVSVRESCCFVLLFFIRSRMRTTLLRGTSRVVYSSLLFPLLLLFLSFPQSLVRLKALVSSPLIGADCFLLLLLLFVCLFLLGKHRDRREEGGLCPVTCLASAQQSRIQPR